MTSEPWFHSQGVPRSLDWNLLWQEALGRFGGKPCLRLRDRWISFLELGERADQQAALLRATQGWNPGSLVLLPVMGECFFPKLLAVWQEGGVAVPWKDEIGAGSHGPEISVDFVWGDGMPEPTGSKSDLPSSGWHAIYCTSGSTGRPRAIIRGWRQALYEAGHYASVIGMREGMECTMLIHPSFGASTKHFLGCLLSGCRQSVPSVTGIPVHGGDLLYGTPSQILARESELISGSGFELVSLTGEPCSSRGWEVIRSLSFPHAKCLNALGGTETGVLINSLSDVHSERSEMSSLCGIGLPGKRLVVVGDDQKPVPNGTPGLLCVESEWIAEGYLDPIPEGADRFNPFQKTETGRLFLTGDVVMEEGGCIHYLGRSGSMIKHRGAWIDTTPLRNALEGAGIGEIHLDRAGERDALRVWIRMENPNRDLLGKVSERLMQILGDSPLLPEILIAIREFPLNPHGKKDLRELARLAESEEVIKERIPTRVERIASVIVNEEWDSRLLKGALRVGELELDSLSLHEVLLEVERLSGHRIPFWKIQPATPLVAIIRSSGDSPQAFSRLDGEAAAPVLLWIGDGVTGIRHELGNQVRILHWNVSAFPGALGTWDASSMRDLAERMIGMADPGDLSGRVVVGGFSAGAVVGHEVSLVLSARGTSPAGLLLLDPPDLNYRPIRSPWRWSHWRPSILCRLLGILPEMALNAANGKLRHALANETRKHVRERRRTLLRNYRVASTTIPAVLATSGSHQEGALRGFAHASDKIEILLLGVEHHTEVMTSPAARSLWVPKLRSFLFTS